MSYRRKKRSTTRKRSTLEDSLLNEEERAVLYAIEATLGGDEDSMTCHLYATKCRRYICSKASISIITMSLIFLVGAILLGVAHSTKLFPNQDVGGGKVTREVAAFLISAGIFGAIGGITNLLGLIMLFYEIPLLYGTGVIPRQHTQIGNIIRKIVIQMLFDSEHMKNYVLERISRFSVEVNIVESITRALNSRKAETIIEENLVQLYSQPEAYYLNVLGISKSHLKPMIRPAILSLCAETAPSVLEKLQETGEHTISVPKIREAIDGYLRYRVHALSGSYISKLMRDLLFRHLSGLIVYGCIVGCLVGILAQGLRFTINPELAIR